MSWEDRVLLKGAYTSPSGVRLEFDFEDVARTTPKRTASFDFARVNGTYVQSNGRGGRICPLTCIFSGADCDLDAKAFEDAVLEDGEGRLEHPLYGTFQAVPMGDIERSDKLKTGAGEATVSVTFVDAIGTVYPDPSVDALGEVGSLADTYDVAQAQEFADNVDVSTVAGIEGIKTQVAGLLDTARVTVGAALADSAEQQRAFTDALDTIEQSLDTLAEAPATLAASVIEALSIPAQDVADISAILTALIGFGVEVRARDGSTPSDYVVDDAIPAGSTVAASNGFHVARLFSAAALSSSASAAAPAAYVARPGAVSAAVALLDELDAHVAWSDTGYETLAEVDTGASYQALLALVATTAGYLVQRSFLLAAERRITLTRPRTIIDLAAELYMSVDDQLDRLIDDNELTGDEMIELPTGAVVVYYA